MSVSEKNPCGKYGLLLGRQSYIDIHNSDALIKTRRHFVIYKWGEYKPSSHSLKLDVNDSVIKYAYVPWVSFSNNKFFVLEHYKRIPVNKIMKPMNRWFNTDEDLKLWMGEKLFNIFVADLI